MNNIKRILSLVMSILMIITCIPSQVFAGTSTLGVEKQNVINGHKDGDKIVFDILTAKNPRRYKQQTNGFSLFRAGEAEIIDQNVKIDLNALGIGGENNFDWTLLPGGLKVQVYFTDQSGVETEKQEVTLTKTNTTQDITLKVPANGGTGKLHAEIPSIDGNIAIRIIRTGESTVKTTVGKGDWSFKVEISEIANPVINLVVKDPYGNTAAAAGGVKAKLHVDGFDGSGLDIKFTISQGDTSFNLRESEILTGEDYDATELNYPGASPALTVEGEKQGKLTLGKGENAVEYKVVKTYLIQDGGTITLTSQPTVIVPTPGSDGTLPGVPKGYARVTFDPTAEGTIPGKAKAETKVFDVLDGTTWEAARTAKPVAVAEPKNPTHATLNFVAWIDNQGEEGKKVLAKKEGNVTTTTFTAEYGEKVKDDNGKTDPDEGYKFVTFDFNGGKKGENAVASVKKQVLIGAKISDAVKYVEDKKLTDGVEKAGKAFGYWSDAQADGSPIFTDEVVTDTLAADKTLYAQYETKATGETTATYPPTTIEKGETKEVTPIVKDKDGNPINKDKIGTPDVVNPPAGIIVTPDKEGKITITVPEDYNGPRTVEIKVKVPVDGITEPIETTITVTITDKYVPVPEKSHEPIIDPIYDSDDVVTGRGVPGSTIEVQFPDGTIERVPVDKDGRWIVPVPYPLYDGEIVRARQIEIGKTPSDWVSQMVRYDEDFWRDRDRRDRRDKEEKEVKKPAKTTKVWTPDALNARDHFSYIKGYGNNIFAPNRTITRAEVAMIFARLSINQSTSGAPQFKDVKAGDWYKTAVDIMARQGVIKGYEDGTFRPNQPITRREFAAIAARYAGNIDAWKTFRDVPPTDWAYTLINRVAGAGWINGYEDGTFRPNNNITRAEVVAIVNRMLNRKADKKYVDNNLMRAKDAFVDNMRSAWYFYDIYEAAIGHSFERQPNGVDEKWNRVNGQAFEIRER